MGLLTDPNNRQRGALGQFILNHHGKLSWLSFCAGVVFLFVLPHPLYNHKTYFSENALLPGLVTAEFSEERAAARYYEDLKEENKRYPGEAPFPWLEAQFKQLGLDVYRQEFSLSYPLANSSYTGSNVYAILRAPKDASKEALVLSAPHRPPNSPHQSTDAGIAVILAAAKFFRKQIYWAKDIIFLITEHEFLGVQAWLEAYHGVQYGGGFIKPGPLGGRAGSIQAAINLEIDSPDITHINVKVEGLNGQLPNLDLVNLVNRLTLREGLQPMFKESEDHSRPDSYSGYLRSLRTMLNMMTSQATGVPSGNHGLFHRFGIEAVTLEGIHSRRKNKPRADFYTLGRIIEGSYRSLNNLLERFHQSFFFYLLSSGSRYVSIGMYMPMFGLLAGGSVLTALGLWFLLLNPSNKEKRLCEAKEAEDVLVPMLLVAPLQFTKVLPIFFISHTLGLLAYILPQHAAKFGAGFGLGPEEAVPLSLAALGVLILLLPVIPRPHLALPPGSWRLAKCLVCLELAALLGCSSLCNISLATLVALLYIPLTLVIRPLKGLPGILLLFFTLMCHPLLLAGAFSALDTVRTFPTVGLSKLVIRSLEAWQRGVMFSIVDSLIYGNVLFDLAAVCLFPCWIVIYLISFTSADAKVEPTTPVSSTEEDCHAKAE